MLPFSFMKFQFSIESVVWPAAWSSPGNLLKVQNLGTPTKHAETLGCSSAISVLMHSRASYGSCLRASVYVSAGCLSLIPLLLLLLADFRSRWLSSNSSHIFSALPQSEDSSWKNNLLSHLWRLICSCQQQVESKSKPVVEKSKGTNTCFGCSNRQISWLLQPPELLSCFPYH